MWDRSKAWIISAVLLSTGLAAWLQAKEPPTLLGLFEGQTDVGTVSPAGTGSFSAATGLYTLTAAGANTWYHVDSFHYLWKKAAGDMSFTRRCRLPGSYLQP